MSSNKSDITTLGDFLHRTEEYFTSHAVFYGHGTDNAWDEAVMLAMHVLSLPADIDASAMELQLNPLQEQELQNLAERRVQERIPVPYLTNTAWFAGERYYVDQNVIIPRSPLAELISQHFEPWLGQRQPRRILDMCTGSGCIAIYSAKEFPDAEVTGVDISTEALAVASKNVRLHQSKVHLVQSDLFTNLPTAKYDIIISNPPYVGSQEMAELPPEYRHEPTLALQSGDDGLQITERILRAAKDYLQPGGLLIVEVGNSWELLAAKYPMLPFIWLEFAYGGDGVFLLHREDLC